MDSSTNKTQIYVRLLNEGTEVSRPTEALDLGDGRFKILPTEHYDPADEIWEFLPGSVVRARRIENNGETYLLAVSSDWEWKQAFNSTWCIETVIWSSFACRLGNGAFGGPSDVYLGIGQPGEIKPPFFMSIFRRKRE